MNLRYSLVPYHYSLAHALSQPGGRPIFRPMVMEYPDDDAFASLTTQWLVGDALLVAPVISPDNATSVVLPAGMWYNFNTSQTQSGPTTLQLQGVALDEVPLYARAGAVVPLAPVVQYTDALPGGPLNVHVYAGTDGSFDMFEDDGETTDYQTKDSKRRTTFSWDDKTKSLSWTVANTGGFQGHSTCFVEVQATAFYPDGSSSSAGPVKIGATGSLSLKA